MTRRVFPLTVALLLCLGGAGCQCLKPGGPGGSGSGIELQPAVGKVAVAIGGEPFTEHVSEGYSRPFLYPLLGPGGARMTRHWPMEDAPNEEHDHPHHKSFWWGHGDMNGVDFWAEGKESGKVVQQSITHKTRGRHAEIKTRNQYVAKDGRVICTDERTLRFYPHQADGARQFDFEITVHADHGELKFGDTKEGTLAVRLAETMRLKGKVGQGRIVNSEGLRDGETWGKRAKWVDYHGPVDGRTVGVAIFDHPANPRHPTWWHVRDYGLFAANPFGIHDFEKKPAGTGDIRVPAGGKITFKYRLLLHAGDELAGKVSERYEKYVQE